MKLSELQTGQRGIIVHVGGEPALCRRLEEMGFIKGKEVDVILNAPLKDPVKYKIMDYDVSLRRAEADEIEVEMIVESPELQPFDGEAFSAQEQEENFSSSLKVINVALVGNPNCGKTSIFNVAAHAHERVGNYSGVTVDVKEGHFKLDEFTFHLFDLPGTYSLSAYSPEERYVRNYITENKPDVVINVVDAMNLERNLFLTAQLMDLDVPMVMALNMFDEFEHSDDELDVEQLSQLFNMPVVPTVGSTGRGVTALFRAVISVYEQVLSGDAIHPAVVNHGIFLEGIIGQLTHDVEQHTDILEQFKPRFFAIKMLEDDHEILSYVGHKNHNNLIQKADKLRIQIKEETHENSESAITGAKYGFVQGALKEVFRQGTANSDISMITKYIDFIVTHRLWGFPIFLLFMYLTFYCTFNFGQYPMDAIEWVINLLANVTSSAMPAGPLKDLVVDGIIGGVGAVIVFLPNILILYLFISFMEDTGYMARAAFIMDCIMHRMGLHGKSFIPMIMGFGCNIPAIMATRTIEDRKSRLITILIVPLMSCSARLPVYMILTGTFFAKHAALVLFGLYTIGVIFAVLMARVFSRFVVKGKSSPFVMELPPYRVPTLKSVVRHTWSKGEQYLRKMGTVILGASILIWFLSYYPNHDKYDNVREQQENSYLGQIGKAVEPVLAPCGFDWKQDVGLLTGAAAKEIIASTMGVLYSSCECMDANGDDSRLAHILQENMTPLSALCFMLFVLLYMPCIPGIVAIYGETGRIRWAAFVILYTTALAWLVSTTVYQLGNLF